MPLVHTDQMVEPAEILAGHLASAALEPDPVMGCDRLNPRIRPLPGMPAAGPRGIDEKLAVNPAPSRLLQKKTFGKRAAADVARAHEENAGSVATVHEVVIVPADPGTASHRHSLLEHPAPASQSPPAAVRVPSGSPRLSSAAGGSSSDGSSDRARRNSRVAASVIPWRRWRSAEIAYAIAWTRWSRA